MSCFYNNPSGNPRHITLLGHAAWLHLPREHDRIISGYFGFVAIWVTHPLWPRRVPLNWRVSDIVIQFRTNIMYDWNGWKFPSTQPLIHTPKTYRRQDQREPHEKNNLASQNQRKQISATGIQKLSFNRGYLFVIIVATDYLKTTLVLAPYCVLPWHLWPKYLLKME
jgi:hypothetical protein